MSARVARRRLKAEWSVRVLLALVAVAIGYVSLRQTLGYALRRGDVARAHAIDPVDGRITGLLADRVFRSATTAGDRQRADELARTALRNNPTAVDAATTLGLNAALRGDAATARYFLSYAQALSRREIAPQLWMIEDAVTRKDIPAALRHYDIALRTSKRASELLFPILASANGDPNIRAELARTLAARPTWAPSFVDYLSLNSADPSATANLFQRLARADISVSDGARAAVLDALIANGRIDQAWAYYASFRAGADRRRSRDERFTQGDVPMPFDWNPRNGGVSASIQRGETGGVFDFSALAGMGGPVLQQVQLLPSGSYRLEGHSIGIQQPRDSHPYWSLRCRDGIEIGRSDVPDSAQADGVFVGTFTVPDGCPVQTLELIVRPSGAVAGVSGQIDRVRLYPAPRK